MPNRESRVQEFNRIYRAAYREAQRNQVVRELARMHAYATALMWWYYGAGEPARPDIVSGYRSPSRQRTLLNRWNRGDRAGLVEKPARQSWHMAGRAIDVERNEWLSVYGWFMERLGARWGMRFGDPNHFDLPGPNRPPAI